MQDQIILSPTTKQELVSEILSGVSDILKSNQKNDLDSKEYLSAKETEILLKVSNVTRYNWTKIGILKSYKIGSRIRYRKDEVLAALKERKSK